MHPAPNPLLGRLVETNRLSASGTTAAVIPAPSDPSTEPSTERALLERALKRQEIAEEAAHVGTFEADLATGRITISREIARLHDVSPSELVVSTQEFFTAVYPEDKAVLLGLAGQRDDFTVDYRYRREDDTTRILEISGRWLPGDVPGHPGYYIGVERDVTEQRAQEAQLRQLALHDPLTGALNRRGFEQLLEQHARRHTTRETGCLLMIDLDDFKHHNDTYGHAIGDAILVAIADALQERLGTCDAIGRIGGDEFVVLLTERRTVEAMAIADELLAVIAGAAHDVSPDPEHPVTASIGVAGFTDDEDVTLALRRADEAMYTAKSAGGARSARWTKHPLTVHRTGDDVAILHRAIAQHELGLVVQPCLHLETGLFNRAETLARWYPPAGGVIGPDRFIPLAEASGLIVPLGEEVLEVAIAHARAWPATAPAIRFSVNVSAMELSTPGFAERRIARIREAGLDPLQITFEVTETTLMENLETSRGALEKLTEAGHRILIDDFGTGYSSISRLSEIPANGIKIDMGLIRRLTVDPAARAVLRAIVDIGRAYDFTVTAEGIEDADTLEIVRELGCDWGQGFFLCPPVSAAELAVLVAQPWSGSAAVPSPAPA